MKALMAATLKAEAPEKKRKLIAATIRLVLRQGYSATSVDHICAEAAVTKGSFFYYFVSKEDICRAAMDAWSSNWQTILTASQLDQITDPLDRLDRLFEIMTETYLRPEVDTGCMIGVVAQETGESNRSLGEPCARHFDVWVQGIRTLLSDAKNACPPRVDFDPASVADLMLGIVQGSFLVARTRQDRAVIESNIRHCRTYLHSLFDGIHTTVTHGE